jgi:uncharacterized protein YozE (UPF0346 family)
MKLCCLFKLGNGTGGKSFRYFCIEKRHSKLEDDSTRQNGYIYQQNSFLTQTKKN